MVLIIADKSIILRKRQNVEFIKHGSTETSVIPNKPKYEAMEDEFIISTKYKLWWVVTTE